MTKPFRPIALVSAVGILLAACASPAGGSGAQPPQIYAAGPTASDIRTLMGDTNWWQGPPSFAVRPLDSAYTPETVRFSVTQRFIHLGTAELLYVRYTIYDKTLSATTHMTNIQTGFGTAATSPKEGDQVLYYAFMSSGAAPYLTRTFVRLGAVVAEIDWARKDGMPSVNQLGRVAASVVNGLKKATGSRSPRVLATPSTASLPPPGLDITFLGAAELPIEAWLVMVNVASPAPVATILHSQGVNSFVFADYALNSDTHMEVRAALLDFRSAADASSWLDLFRDAALDQNGISGTYIDALAEYHYLFAAGTHGAMLICRSTADTEAASRACEGPMLRTANSWKFSLSG